MYTLPSIANSLCAFPSLEKDFYSPGVDISEQSEKYSIELDIPGVTKEEVKIELDGHWLAVSGERKGRGTFKKVFSLPEEVDKEKISAEHKDGVLFISVPKTEKAKPREIRVA